MREIDGILSISEVTSPATPGSNTLVFFSKNDHKFYIKDSLGAETALT